MNHLVISRGRRFHDRLAHGRVGVDRFDDIVAGGFEFVNRYRLGHRFGDIGADHVTARQFAVSGVEDQFFERGNREYLIQYRFVFLK